MIMDKIPERFPKFKVAFLEASSQWLPYVLKDLDKRYKLQGRELNAKDLLRRSRFYVGCETSDDLPYIMGQAKVVGEKLYRSYYFDSLLLGLAVTQAGPTTTTFTKLPTESWSFQTSNLPQVVQSLSSYSARLIKKSHKPKNSVSRSQTYSQKAHRSRPRANRASATRAYIQSFKPVADCFPGPNLRRFRVNLDVERESVWLDGSGHRWFTVAIVGSMCCHCPSRRIRSES
jgi:hypothetical protein